MTVLAHPARFRQAAVTLTRPRTGLVLWVQRLVLLAVAWGALAIGGVYPWGYWPLAIAGGACGLAGLLISPSGRVQPVRLSLIAAAGALVAVIAIQLVPLPLHWLSAERLHAIQALDPMVAAGLRHTHPISIWPDETWRGLALLVAFALLVAGLTRLFSLVSPRNFVVQLTIFGLLLAIAGIVQKPLYHGKIFGLWAPLEGTNPFGPFVNKNHFAGWMVMTLPLAFALLGSRVTRAMRGVKPDWRSRMLWLASPEANSIVLTLGAAAIMAFALVLTMSRSGMLALTLALMLMGTVAIRRAAGGRRAATLASFALIVAGIVWAVGSSVIVDRFASTEWADIDMRRDAWADTADIIRHFPVAGTGYNTFGSSTLIYQHRDMSDHLAQAHNDYLQLLSEGGLLVAVPAFLLLLIFVTEVRSRFRHDISTSTYWLRVGAVTGLAAIGLQETVEFSLQMPGNAILFAVLCAIALHRQPATTRTQHLG